MYDGEDEMDTSGVMIEDCLNNIVNTDLKKGIFIDHEKCR